MCVALGSKHSTCDSSRHWHKKNDAQRHIGTFSARLLPCSAGISDGLLSHWVTPKNIHLSPLKSRHSYYRCCKFYGAVTPDYNARGYGVTQASNRIFFAPYRGNNRRDGPSLPFWWNSAADHTRARLVPLRPSLFTVGKPSTFLCLFLQYERRN